MIKREDFQKVFFETIKQRLPKHISVVHEIAELLEISYDSAYRRLRGDKDLTIDELQKLSHKYKISVDSVFGYDNIDIHFHPFVMDTQHDGFVAWLKLRLLEVQKIYDSGTKELIMVARDLPISYYFDFPELAAFKIYFWKKLLLHHPEYHNKKFNISEQNVDILELGTKLLSMYNKIPSVEIWCQETFTRIMQQIDFCCISGLFMHKNDAVTLYENLEILIRHLQYQTEQGCKFHYGAVVTDNEEENFKIFVNEILLIDNTAFVQRDGKKILFLTHNSLDILLTSNPLFCNQVEHALRIIMKTGTHISGTSALECNRFFNSIYAKLEEYKKDSVSSRFIL